MKVAIHLSEKVTYKWPLEYWVELIGKLTKQGHEVYAFSDEPYVRIDDTNPLLFDRLRLTDEIAKTEIAKCDVFVGAPLKYYDMAKEAKVRTVGLLGATHKGEGVKTTAPCGACRDNMENINDCIFEDEMCGYEITPNDVLEVVCR
jgi:ADP-heptose:LPS heptosyltransferase